MEIGDRVREFRRRKALTQGQLAEAVGRNRSTISLIEANRNFPHPSTVQRLADALGVPPEALTDPTWGPAAPKEPPPHSMDELLERAGLSDKHLTMSLDEIGAAFDGLSYQEAYELACSIIDARRAVIPILEQYKDTPEEQTLTAQSNQVNMIGILSFREIAEKERSRAIELGDNNRAAAIAKEKSELNQRARAA